MNEQDPIKLAIAALEFCLKTIKCKNTTPSENAIWSAGTSSKPRITEETLSIALRALQSQPATDGVGKVREALDYFEVIWRQAEGVDLELNKYIRAALARGLGE